MTPDIHTLAGAYVLDAVEHDERTDFEAHLIACESCREEVEALRMATTALGGSVSSTPPEDLRRRILAQVARTPQLPPLAPALTPPHRRRWPILVAAAAAALIVGGVGVTVVAHRGDDRQQTYSASQIFRAPDARTSTIAIGNGSVRVGVSSELGLVAIDGADMPPLPGHKVYQLWLLDRGEATSLAVMDHSTSAVESIPSSGSLAVTAEPAGGSTSPTSAPLLTLDTTTL